MRQEHPPSVVCSVCHHFSNDLGLVNERCGQRHGGVRCRGANGSALNETDWQVCEICRGDGDAGGECPTCQGTGWQYIRDRRRAR